MRTGVVRCWLLGLTLGVGAFLLAVSPKAGPSAEAAVAATDLSTPLYDYRLDEMLDQLAGRQAVAEIDEDVLIDPAANSGDETETALIVPSGLFSACAASGCFGSACGASGCLGSGCTGSGCAGSACGGSACGGTACGGSACGGSACLGSACLGSGCIGSACLASICAGSGCGGSLCAGSACLGSACAGSGCGGSACGGSACGGSVCGGSVCGASVCGGSGCVGSGCGGSGCVGSGCGASGCVGSACANCNSSVPNGGTQHYAGRGDAAVVAVACPYSTNDDPMANVQVTGFNIEREGDVAEISWVTAGGEVTAFRLYRLSGEHRELVAEGPAPGGRLQRVAAADDDPAAGYVVELVDALGWVTRIGSDGSTERLTELRADVERPDGLAGLRLSSL